MGTETTKELDVLLGEEEVAERARMMAERVNDFQVTKAEAKAIAKTYKVKTDKQNDEIIVLGAAVRTKRERRNVRCIEQVDDRLMRINTVRLDTMKVVETRAMTSDELSGIMQPDLFSRDAAATADSNDSGYLPNHPVIEGQIGNPPDRLPCPGPKGGTGCAGNDCHRCAGAKFIPASSDVEPPPEPVVVPDAAASEATSDDDEDDDADDADGTEIDNPTSLLDGEKQ